MVDKRVIWFLMSPIKKTGKLDPDEIFGTRWAALSSAAKLVKYPSDKKLLEKIKRR